MINWKRVAFIATMTYLICNWPTEGHEQIQVRVLPRQAVAPATVRVIIHVEPQNTNRHLVLAWNSDNYSGSHEWPLDDTAPTQFVFDLKDIPIGHYDIEAKVFRTMGNSAHCLDFAEVH